MNLTFAKEIDSWMPKPILRVGELESIQSRKTKSWENMEKRKQRKKKEKRKKENGTWVHGREQENQPGGCTCTTLQRLEETSQW